MLSPQAKPILYVIRWPKNFFLHEDWFKFAKLRVCEEEAISAKKAGFSDFESILIQNFFRPPDWIQNCLPLWRRQLHLLECTCRFRSSSGTSHLSCEPVDPCLFYGTWNDRSLLLRGYLFRLVFIGFVCRCKETKDMSNAAVPDKF